MHAVQSHVSSPDWRLRPGPWREGEFVPAILLGGLGSINDAAKCTNLQGCNGFGVPSMAPLYW